MTKQFFFADMTNADRLNEQTVTGYICNLFPSSEVSSLLFPPLLLLLAEEVGMFWTSGIVVLKWFPVRLLSGSCADELDGEVGG